MPFYRLDNDGLLLDCHIQPGARQDEICGLHDKALKIRISAPASDNRANRQLIGFLSKTLSLPKSRITIVKGEHSRQKTVKLEGVDRLPPGLCPP